MALANIEELLNVAEQLIQQQNDTTTQYDKLLGTAMSRMETMKAVRLLVQNQLNTQLEALLGEEKQVRAGADRDEQFKQLSQQEQQLRQELSAVQSNNQELSTRCDELKTQGGRLTEEVDQLQTEIDRLENETTVQIPKRREEINLYNCVSKILWDFDGSEEEAKGYVQNKDNVKPFSFDTRKCSQYFITNALWDSMQEG